MTCGRQELVTVVGRDAIERGQSLEEWDLRPHRAESSEHGRGMTFLAEPGDRDMQAGGGVEDAGLAGDALGRAGDHDLVVPAPPEPQRAAAGGEPQGGLGRRLDDGIGEGHISSILTPLTTLTTTGSSGSPTCLRVTGAFRPSRAARCRAVWSTRA